MNATSCFDTSVVSIDIENPMNCKLNLTGSRENLASKNATMEDYNNSNNDDDNDDEELNSPNNHFDFDKTEMCL